MAVARAKNGSDPWLLAWTKDVSNPINFGVSPGCVAFAQHCLTAFQLLFSNVDLHGGLKGVFVRAHAAKHWKCRSDR